MKLIKIACACLIVSLNASASEGHDGNGGDAVVCFDIPLSEAMNDDGTMTPEGRKQIKSATPVEVFLARRMNIQPGSLLMRLENATYEEAEKDLHAFFMKIPLFHEMLERSQKAILRITYGIKAEDGLRDINDSGAVIIPPAGCSYVQAVVRRFTEMSYDPDIFTHYSPFEEAVTLLHERIYLIAKELGKENSVSTQVVISEVLSRRVSENRLAEVLRVAEFGTFDPLSVELAQAEKFSAYLNQMELQTNLVFEYRIEYENRRLKSTDPLFSKILDAREVLSDMYTAAEFAEFRKDTAFGPIAEGLWNPTHRLADNLDMFDRPKRTRKLREAKSSFDKLVTQFRKYETKLKSLETTLRESVL